MNLSTTWLGLDLKNPMVVGASPLSHDVAMCRRLEDAGAAALVMHSLFMEQLTGEEDALSALDAHTNAHAEAASYFTEPKAFALGPDEYLQQVRDLKEALGIPVVASINGTHDGDWTAYAHLLEEAGADAVELNVHYLAVNGDDASAVEQRYVDILSSVKGAVKVPVSMKLGYFFTSPVVIAKRLDEAGADGLVLFNRVFHPQIDIEKLEMSPVLSLQRRASLPLRLMWASAMFGKIDADLAISGGVVEVVDLIRSMMSGARVAQMTSVLLERGPGHLIWLKRELDEWMEEHEYESIAQMQGSMSLERSPNPKVFERANYMRALRTWHPGRSWFGKA